MQITTKHRDRLRWAIREKLYAFRIEEGIRPSATPAALDNRLRCLMADVEDAALEVLKVPQKKKPRR